MWLIGTHTFFSSSEENSGEDIEKEDNDATLVPSDIDNDDLESDTNNNSEDDGEYDNTQKRSKFYERAEYKGRANVKNVRDNRKRLGLNEQLDAKHPMMNEFRSYLEETGKSKNDATNKVIF